MQYASLLVPVRGLYRVQIVDFIGGFIIVRPLGRSGLLSVGFEQLAFD